MSGKWATRGGLRALVMGVVLATVATFATAGAAAAASTKIVKGGTLSFATNVDTVTFDPAGGAAVNGSGPDVGAVYDALALLDPVTLKVVPRIAESFTPNADATVWTVKIRPGVTFSDGTVFDANAVKADWDRLKTSSTVAGTKTIVNSFTSYVVSDPLTLVVTLPQARGAFPTYLVGPLGTIPSPTAVAKYGNTYGTSPTTTVGAGPFLLTEWVRGDHKTVVRNTSYWQKGKPYLNSIVYKVLENPDQKVDGLTTGSFNVGFFSGASAATVKGQQAGLTTLRVTDSGAYGAQFNLSKAPLNDLRVRQALVLATDGNDIDQKAAAGG